MQHNILMRCCRPTVASIRLACKELHGVVTDKLFVAAWRRERGVASMQGGLMAAIRDDNAPLISLLLTNGAPKNKRLLSCAIRYGKSDAMAAFVNHGCVFDKEMHSELLGYAAQMGHVRVVDMALRNGWVNMHDENDILLRCAANGLGKDAEVLAVIELLLHTYGADVHALNDDALRTAAEFGRLPIVHLLLANGANVHACDDGALFLARRMAYMNEPLYAEIIEVLVKNGASHENADKNLHKDRGDFLASFRGCVCGAYLTTMYDMSSF